MPIDSILIKLDIEGSEPLALNGMKDIMQRVSSVVIFAEINPSALDDSGLGPKDMIRELELSGFTVHFVDESSRQVVPVMNMTDSKKGMLYCVRED